MSKQADTSAEYEKNYSDNGFWNKIQNVFKKAGLKVVYMALSLYYTLEEEDVPIWAKTTIVGALGYFISPIDAIPDITPVVGYSDDLGVLALAIASVGFYISERVKQKAKSKLHDWFGDFEEKELLN